MIFIFLMGLTYFFRAIKVDEFTKQLYKMYTTVRDEGFAQVSISTKFITISPL